MYINLYIYFINYHLFLILNYYSSYNLIQSLLII